MSLGQTLFGRIGIAAVVAGPLVFGGGMPVAAGAVVRCGGLQATVVGTSEADVLRGSSRPDVIAGLGGADVLVGLAGGDVLCGGRGADVLMGGRGDDTLKGGWGGVECSRFNEVGTIEGDRLRGGPGSDRLNGGVDPRHQQESEACRGPLIARNDLLDFSTSSGGLRVDLESGLVTGQGRDVVDGAWDVKGSRGDDVILGAKVGSKFGLGTSSFDGGPGADRIWGRATGSSLAGGTGADRIHAGTPSFFVFGDAGADILRGGPADRNLLVGGPGPDRITGGTGDEEIVGNSGADRLWGRGGHDKLIGSTGADLLWGGEGRDQMFWVDLEDRLAGGPGRDRIDAVLQLLESTSGSAPAMGGPGIDRMVWVDSRVPSPVEFVTVDLERGVTMLDDQVLTSRGFENLVLRAESNWRVIGTAAANRVNFSHGRFQTGPGTLRVRLRGGDDVVFGTHNRDVLDGGDGHDTAKPRAGQDTCVAFEEVIGRC